MRKTIQNMTEKLAKDTHITEKNKFEILRLKISITEIKTIIESFSNRLEQEEKRISKLEDTYRIYPIRENRRKKNMKKIDEAQHTEN